MTNPKMQRCAKCGELKPESEFYFSKTAKRFLRQCKTCCKKYAAIYKTEHLERCRKLDTIYNTEHKEQRKINRITWYAANPQAQQAHSTLNVAIKGGYIIRPSHCSACGKKNGIIEAHHEDYLKPYDVIWLCKSCHHKLHTAGRIK